MMALWRITAMVPPDFALLALVVLVGVKGGA